jgi:hypothetical protein
VAQGDYVVPICKKCENRFPNRIMIDGKWHVLNRRKYCFDCSPFDKHNTKVLHEVPKSEIVSEIIEDKEIECLCTICGRKYVYGRNGHTKNKCNSCLTNHKRHEIKDKMIEYKGGKCQRCGYNKTTAALQFHHINPETKEFSPSGNHGRSWNVAKKELDKCELLCANCHAEVHAEERETKTACETLSSSQKKYLL